MLSHNESHFYTVKIVMQNNTKKDQPYFIASLERGTMVLEALARNKGPLGLAELASLTRMSPATATRYVMTLVSLGYVIRDPANKQFRISPKVLSLGFSFLRNMDLRTRVSSHLLEAARRLNVGAQCGVLDGTEIVYVERIQMNAIVDLDIPVGSRLPAYCTALGKVILAFMDREQAAGIIRESDLVAHTHFTEIDQDKLISSLEVIRKQGFAINRQELILGRNAMAAPIFRNDAVEGAIGFSFPFQKEKETGFEQNLVEVLKDISRKASLTSTL
jgi:IclR family transcriptional regulator, pca regulon regulatory protein